MVFEVCYNVLEQDTCTCFLHSHLAVFLHYPQVTLVSVLLALPGATSDVQLSARLHIGGAEQLLPNGQRLSEVCEPLMDDYALTDGQGAW